VVPVDSRLSFSHHRWTQTTFFDSRATVCATTQMGASFHSILRVAGPAQDCDGIALLELTAHCSLPTCLQTSNDDIYLHIWYQQLCASTLFQSSAPCSVYSVILPMEVAKYNCFLSAQFCRLPIDTSHRAQPQMTAPSHSVHRVLGIARGCDELACLGAGL